MALIEDFDSGNDMNGIDSAGTGVSKDGDENMLLDIERTRVEGELVGRASEEDAVGNFGSHEVAERDDGDLGRDGRDGERLCSVPEELVQEGEQDARECS